MNFLTEQFHRQQALLKTRKSGVSGRQYVAPLFTAEVLCDVDPESEHDRIAEWRRKTYEQNVARVDEKRLSACRVKVARRIARNRIEDRRAAA